jgi:hypothetical protein
MTDTSTKVREHYSATNLTIRINAALATLAPEGQMLTVAQLAPLDQFHTRGILATTELNRSWARAVDRRTERACSLAALSRINDQRPRTSPTS